ncbi:hypothetical protein AB3S75_047096 [Citrus x aurantiifolia]
MSWLGFKLVLVVFVLLAATAQNKCTALVCSCYVPSRSFSSRSSEDSDRSNISKKRLCAENKRGDGVTEKLHGNNNIDETQGQDKSIDGCWNGLDHDVKPSNLKSNLKKTTMTELEAENQEFKKATEKRKVVTWPDANGKDIAHVHEFEPSTTSEDGELGEIRSSCVCTIQ